MKITYPDGATPLDPDELEGLKFKLIKTRSDLDRIEQANIQEGLLWLKRVRRKDILTENFVCDLHEKLFGQVWYWAGRFRNTGRNIGVDPAIIAVELRQLLDDTAYWIDHHVYDPIEAAVRFHHRLVFIHPFVNGNGRHARIMADAVLERLYEHPPIDWSGGQDLQSMTSRRKDYFDALRSADRHDYGPLLSFAGVMVGSGA